MIYRIIDAQIISPYTGKECDVMKVEMSTGSLPQEWEVTVSFYESLRTAKQGLVAAVTTVDYWYSDSDKQPLIDRLFSPNGVTLTDVSAKKQFSVNLSNHKKA